MIKMDKLYLLQTCHILRGYSIIIRSPLNPVTGGKKPLLRYTAPPTPWINRKEILFFSHIYIQRGILENCAYCKIRRRGDKHQKFQKVDFQSPPSIFVYIINYDHKYTCLQGSLPPRTFFFFLLFPCP